MIERLQIYKCEICGNIVEVLHVGGGKLVCCGQEMILLPEQTEEQGKEKHVPVIEKIGEDTFVKVGAVPHPMLPEHYIEWADVIRPDRVIRAFFKPGEEAKMKVCHAENILKVREHCTVHGLWATK